MQLLASRPAEAASRDALQARYAAVRRHTQTLAAPLSAEDQCVQSMPDASPAKWHQAHTSWFFEALVLRELSPAYQPFDERFFFLFNSYYEALGPRHPRPARGLLTRPSLDEVTAYRAHVDRAVERFIGQCDADTWRRAAPLIELGLNHEQQHQELLLTDILHAFSLNALQPAMRPAQARRPARSMGPARFIEFDGGAQEIGHDGVGFAFDNETPRHRVWLQPYALADRLVSCAEYRSFIADGGYRRPELWLSDGWAQVQTQGWRAPLYWQLEDGTQFSLHGARALADDEPVCHLSFYEAAAFAQWAGARLPTEAEWEVGAASGAAPQDLFGAVWQWTRSSYDPYPGFKPPAGAVGEYNGKFMVGQLVLRGSSSATPPGHERLSYRNFFPPSARWQFSGLRLAKDL
jgi:ergothioneine biosynthesis protein EgtB